MAHNPSRTSDLSIERSEAESRNLPGCTQRGVLYTVRLTRKAYQCKCQSTLRHTIAIRLSREVRAQPSSIHPVIPSEASPPSSCHSERSLSAVILSFRAQPLRRHPVISSAKRSGVEKSPRLHSPGCPVHRQTHAESVPVQVPVNSAAYHRHPSLPRSPSAALPTVNPVISSEAKRSREISLAALNGVSCTPSNPPGKRTGASASQLCGIPSPSVSPAKSERSPPLSILSFRAQRSGVEKSPWLHSTGCPVHRQTHPESAPARTRTPQIHRLSEREDLVGAKSEAGYDGIGFKQPITKEVHSLCRRGPYLPSTSTSAGPVV